MTLKYLYMHIKISERVKLKLDFGDYSGNRGTDICSFFEIKEERDEIPVGFFYEGTMDSDVRVFIPSKSSEVNLAERFTNKYPCCPDHVGDGTSFTPLILSSHG